MALNSRLSTEIMANNNEQETLTEDPLLGAVRALQAGGRGLRFVEAFIREPLKVGSLWPSSSALSRALVGGCEFQPGDTVVELGPGTGAFTELLLKRLQGHGRMVALEISPTNINVLRKRFSPCEIIHDSAEHLARYLDRQSADCIISGLAWGSMLPALQDRIFDAMLEALAPDGQFVAFGYIHAKWFPTSRRFRRRLLENFQRVESTPIVWRNLPPAFVYRCWRD
jgi:phosphatidylethanolamine/phosphatidyl-N-methylethanolamine N-methyltransferase